jgi:putative spermidine/putrescine transport system ATP-binding protein
LRLIAGFLLPDEGRVLLRGADVTELPPNKRDVGMLFQSYALFPHMTVAANIGYGLKMRSVPAHEIRRRVNDALELVQLRELAGRYPRQLSGGQQQRVALARAVVIRPSVLLLDEPLSNLDANLRKQMRSEIRTVQQALGITTILVTHDQEEALSMSDRVVVMNQGRVEQSGSPEEIYRAPASLFMAQFVGDANVLPGRLVTSSSGAGLALVTDGLEIATAAGTLVAPGEPAAAIVRPECVRVLHPEDDRMRLFENRVQGVVQSTTFAGPVVTIAVRLADGALIRAAHHMRDPGESFADPVPTAGDRVLLAWSAAACRVVPLS